MRRQPALPHLILLVSWVLIPAGASAAMVPGAAVSGSAVNDGSIPGILFSTALANLSIAVIAVLILVGGLYAYASLARFAPYHSWIYLYLISLSGVVWALFLVKNGGSLSDSVFILTTVVGINLIVHVLRFDRIEMPFPAPAGT